MTAISNSEVATFSRCRRQWYLKYYLGTAPADEPPAGIAQLGTRVHASLEGYYGFGLDPLTVLHTLYALEIEARPEYRADLLKERDLSTPMVEGYVEWAAEEGIDAGLTVVSVEQDVEVPFPLVPGVSLKARMDQVALNEDTGALSFLDWKTAASFDRHEVLALDPQFKFYSVVQRLARPAHVPLVDGGIIRTLRRVKRTSKSTPPYYQTDSFRYSPEVLEAAELRIAKICREIMTARRWLDEIYRRSGGELGWVNQVQRSEVPPSPRLHECRWDCPFVQLCPMMDDGSDWPGVIVSSGRYIQTDPYSYYRDDPVKAVRAVLEGRYGDSAGRGTRETGSDGAADDSQE